MFIDRTNRRRQVFENLNSAGEAALADDQRTERILRERTTIPTDGLRNQFQLRQCQNLRIVGESDDARAFSGRGE